jgi:hypothetical protein
MGLYALSNDGERERGANGPARFLYNLLEHQSDDLLAVEVSDEIFCSQPCLCRP